ncbi:MAG: MMPL family transporter [Oscillospiraceae bacterium]|nr:MMPL family transporter [Oscillospiraceae bacterium]
MSRFINTVIKRKTAVLIITAIILVLSVVFMSFIDVNLSTSSYLPSDISSVQKNKLLSDSFGLDKNAKINIYGKLSDYEKISVLIDEISVTDGISNIMWLGTFDEIIDTKGEHISSKSALINENALATIASPYYNSDDGFYTISLNIEENSKSHILDILARSHFKFRVGGNAFNTTPLFKVVLQNLGFVLLGFIVVLLAIYVTSYKSKISCFVFASITFASVLIGIGTNIFAGDISVISLLLSLLFSIFFSVYFMLYLSQIYAGTYELSTALIKAYPTILKTAGASSVTILALCGFSLSLGVQMGVLLAKAIIISAVLVIFVVPAPSLLIKKSKWETPLNIKKFSLDNLYNLPFKFRAFSLLLSILLAFLGAISASSITIDYNICDDETASTVFAFPKISDAKQLELIGAINQNHPNLCSLEGYYATLSVITDDFIIPIYEPDNSKVAEIIIPANAILEYLKEGEITTTLDKIISAQVNQVVIKKSPAIIKEEIIKLEEQLGSSVDILKQVEVSRLTIARIYDEYYQSVIKQIEKDAYSVALVLDRLETQKQSHISEINGIDYTYLFANVKNDENAKKTIEDINSTISNTLKTEAVFYSGSTTEEDDLSNSATNNYAIVLIISLCLAIASLMAIFREFRHSLVAIFAISASTLTSTCISALFGDVGFIAHATSSAISMSIAISFSLPIIAFLRYSLRDKTPLKTAIEQSIKISTPIILLSSFVLIISAFCIIISAGKILREVLLSTLLGTILGGLSAIFILPSLLAIVKYKSSN